MHVHTMYRRMPTQCTDARSHNVQTHAHTMYRRMFTQCTLGCSHTVCIHVHRCTTHRCTSSTHLLVAVSHITDLVPREGDLWCQDVSRFVDIDPVSVHTELQICPLLVLCGQEATETHQVLCSWRQATLGNQVNSNTQQHTASQ